ncbi:MAG TPA: sigma factor-like helix-turn-helix DNA-binding protein [Terriglobales bacterium]|nr:sigma factor-like helix-turn-helix DNA-binding protein [Terriglobales bacterium]
MKNFEDLVIFVHDMEQAIEKLDPLQKQLLAMNVLEDYSPPEVARLLGCSLRSVERFIPEAVDELSRVLLAVGILDRAPLEKESEEVCQEARNRKDKISSCN